MLFSDRQQRLAVLDLGSNALCLLVADCSKDAIIPITSQRKAVRLAQDMGACLNAAAKQRTQSAVAEFSRQARAMGAQKVILAATHVARQASDGAAFVAALQRDCGLDQALVLSAQQESLLARLGVQSAYTGNRQGAWVVDVGAGSCELAPLDGQTQGYYLPIGALSLHEKFIRHDPPRQVELKSMRTYIHQYNLGQHKIKGPLLATSGAATCLASLDLGLSQYEPDKINNHTVKRARLQAILGHLAVMPVQRRAGLLGMGPGRADIIVPGLLLLSEIMAAHKKSSVTILGAGLLEGSLLAYVNICKEIFCYE